MKKIQEFEDDIYAYLNKEENLSKEDRASLLVNLFQKHLLLMNADLKLNYLDFLNIKGDSIALYQNSNLRMRLGKRELQEHEVIQVFLLESFVGFLNNKGALNRQTKFDKE